MIRDIRATCLYVFLEDVILFEIINIERNALKLTSKTNLVITEVREEYKGDVFRRGVGLR